MAEHLALDQAGRQGPAVDRQQRLVATQREPVDHTSQAGLARAGLAPQQDGRILGSDPANLLDHLSHPPAWQEEERFITRNCRYLALRRERNGLGTSGSTATGEGQNIDEIAKSPQIQRAAQILGDPQTQQSQNLLRVILFTQNQDGYALTHHLDRTEQPRESRDQSRRSEMGQEHCGFLVGNLLTSFVVIPDPFEPNARNSSNDILNHPVQGRILTDQHRLHIAQGSPPLSRDRTPMHW